MDPSILTSVKKVLGLADNYDAFDADVVMFVNSAFSVLDQLGVVSGFAIEDEASEWDVLDLPTNQLSLVKSYVLLKVRSLFDPPKTSFHLEAINKQLSEMEWRLSVFRENLLPAPTIPEEDLCL